MLKIVTTTRFEREVKLAASQGKDLDKLRLIMQKLSVQEPLEAKHKDHSLIGNYCGRRECHIQPDWLLIYFVDADRIIFERTGTHADLFRK